MQMEQLWAETPLQPVTSQRPLWDPQLEGERALHWLETVPPASLWQQLIPLATSAALECLGESGGAKLPSAREALQR